MRTLHAKMENNTSKPINYSQLCVCRWSDFDADGFEQYCRSCSCRCNSRRCCDCRRCPPYHLHTSSSSEVGKNGISNYFNDPMLFYYFSYHSFMAFVCQPIKVLYVINCFTRIVSNQWLKIIAINLAVNLNFSSILCDRSCHWC